MQGGAKGTYKKKDVVFSEGIKHNKSKKDDYLGYYQSSNIRNRYQKKKSKMKKATRNNKSNKSMINTSPEETKNKFQLYSTQCPGSQNRQPIILNQAEKDEIDEKDRRNKYRSYTTSIKQKDHYFICPRFFVLMNKTNIVRKSYYIGN